MDIYIYWNSKDKDCKKIFHCLSPRDEDTIIPIFDESCIDRRWKRFNKNVVERRIKDANTVIFCTHGGTDEILKYLQNDKKDCDNFILIDKNNIKWLKDKIVIALCCDSAKNLGPQCIEGPDRCKAYIGFETPIYYDDEEAISNPEETHRFTFGAYRRAIKNTLLFTKKNNSNVKTFKEMLIINIRKEMFNESGKYENGSLKFSVMTTMDGLVALGDTNAKVFI